MKKNLKINILFPVIIFIALFGWAESSSAATVFLDIAATGCTGGGSANTNYNPATRSCGSGSDKVYAGNYPFEASDSLQNGDTLYIRAGEYWEDAPGTAWYAASLSISADNLVVQNYNNETVWIKGGPDRTTPAAHPNNALGFGGSNNVVDGLNIYGGTLVSASDSTLQNCDLSGGWDHQSQIWDDGTQETNWANVIRFVDARNALVKNCSFHDNVLAPGESAGSSNMSIIMHEHDKNTIVENSHFYNVLGGYGFGKYQPHPTELRLAAYEWRQHGLTDEWYVVAAGGGNPNFPNKPVFVLENPVCLASEGFITREGSLGSLTYEATFTGSDVHHGNQWGWGDQDGLGFDTIYVHSTQDPDLSCPAVNISGTYQNGYWAAEFENADHYTYRNNWYDSQGGFVEGAASFFGYFQNYNNNVFSHSSSVAQTRGRPFPYIRIYNNTVYDYRAIASWPPGASHDFQFFNNIVYNDSGTVYAVWFDEVSQAFTLPSYYDYNDYFATGGGSLYWRHNYSTLTTLANWSARVGTGEGTEDFSVNTDPGFLNASGNFNVPSDFKRSSYPTNGRGGSYPSVMGAYVTGNECIGLLDNCAGGGGDTTAPSAPQGLSVQ